MKKAAATVGTRTLFLLLERPAQVVEALRTKEAVKIAVENKRALEVHCLTSCSRSRRCLLDVTLQFFGLRQFELVLGYEEPIVHACQGVLHKSMILARAKKDADGRLVAFGHLVGAVVTDIGIELAEVFVAEFVHLEFHQHMALEHAMVENEVHEKRLAADEQAFLAPLEAESVAEFQQEVLQSLDERSFQLGFGQHLLWPQAEELENVRIADDVFRLRLGPQRHWQFRTILLCRGKAPSARSRGFRSGVLSSRTDQLPLMHSTS